MPRLNLPPQAYTRETMTAAFNWLKNQPRSVQDRASSVDAMVSLYNHARRHGIEYSSEGLSFESSESQRSFKSDLKNLANGLKQFEYQQEQLQKQSNTSEVKETEAHPAPPTYTPPRPSSSLTAPERQQSRGAPDSQMQPSLDPKSLQMVSRVQMAMNLSSPSEALRMLLSLGFERIKALLPEDPKS